MRASSPICYGLLTLCLVVTVPGVFSTGYYEVFSGELPHEYWWQPLTTAFQHGAVDMPAAIIGHLMLNMILLLTGGRMTEQLLGSKKMLMLSLAAWAVFVLTQWLSGIWVNGSSGVIWAYSPFLLIPIRRARRDPDLQPRAEIAKGLLIIMWGVATVSMGFAPLLFNPDHSLLHTFVFGNLFHGIATLVGFLFFFFWKK